MPREYGMRREHAATSPFRASAACTNRSSFPVASRWQFRVQVRPATSSPAGSLGDGCGADARTYARRKPEASDLYRVVEEEIETFLAAAASGERPAPRFVAPELRAFLRCGILVYGFVRVHCDVCGHDRVVAFSCKGRGFCPSCGSRRENPPSGSSRRKVRRYFEAAQCLATCECQTTSGKFNDVPSDR